MYTDRKSKRWLWLAAAVLLGVLLGVVIGWGRYVSARHVAEQSASALKEAVLRSARQCYVVEGVYPPDLEYLEEHYGLQVNHAAYYISYDAFASNLPPDIRVIPRTGG